VRLKRRAALALAVVFAVACAARPEQAVLSKFFGASRLRDFTALHDFATVIVEPTRDGMVNAFDIAGITTTRTANSIVESIAVDASMTMPDGRPARKRIVVTMERPAPDDSNISGGHWTVTAFTTVTADAATFPR
jgi:hypothetical protein